MKHEIKCGVIHDLLPLYEDGVASEETTQLVREHLKDCPACQEELRKMRVPVSMPAEKDGELWCFVCATPLSPGAGTKWVARLNRTG